MRLKSLILNHKLCLLISLLCFHGCGLFSFLDDSLPPDVQAFSIKEFYTEVSDGPIDMPQKLTEALEAKILRTTILTKEEKDGDLQYEGIIKSFSYLATSSTKDEQNNPKEILRLTITIEVSCLNRSGEAAPFKKKFFSASADMLSTENQLEKEPVLIKEIFRQLVDDIYNASIGNNW